MKTIEKRPTYRIDFANFITISFCTKELNHQTLISPGYRLFDLWQLFQMGETPSFDSPPHTYLNKIFKKMKNFLRISYSEGDNRQLFPINFWLKCCIKR
jgi:hypothetical protein